MSRPAERFRFAVFRPAERRGGLLSGLLVALVPVFTVLLCACARPPAPGELPRADPGRVAWLERQSMLTASAELIRVVSGSDVAWRRPVDEIPSPPLLKGSAMWLVAEPQTLLTNGRSPLAELGSPDRLALFADLGLSGVFLAPLEASGRDWRPERSALIPDTDVTSFELAEATGSDQDLRILAENAASRALLLGAPILPAHTGLGPDFFLALRAVRDWPGAYVMLEIPPRDWPLLPPGQAALPAALRDDLMARKVLPRLVLPGNSPGSGTPVAWAVSEPVAGQDGQTRRWAYLFAGSPDRPLLNWEDPSATARRLFSASVIRQVGIRRIPLAGLSLGPLFGLNPAGPDKPGMEPGLSALRDLAREIRRYGGWSLLLDRVPPARTPQILESGCDLLADNVTSPAAEYALLSGDAGPLRTALDGTLAQKADQRRFFRPLSSSQRLAFDMPGELSQDQRDIRESLPREWKAVLGWKENALRASAPALAAARAGLKPQNVSLTDAAAVRAPHAALLLFRAGLPGVLGLSGQDLAGVTHSPFAGSPDGMPLPDERVLPAWGLAPGTQASTAGGVPGGKSVYGPLTAQADEPDSFAATVKRAATVRRQTGVAAGTLLGRPPTVEPGSAAVLVRLPQGDLLLTVVNFSDSVVRETFALPRQASGQARDLLREADIKATDGRLTLKLEPFACRMLLFPVRAE